MLVAALALIDLWLILLLGSRTFGGWAHALPLAAVLLAAAASWRRFSASRDGSRPSRDLTPGRGRH